MSELLYESYCPTTGASDVELFPSIREFIGTTFKTDFDRCRKTIFVIIFHFISDLLRWKSSPRNFRSKRSSSNWFIIQFSHRKGNSERWIFLSITNSLWKLYLIRRERGLRIIWNKFYLFLDKYLGIIG